MGGGLAMQKPKWINHWVLKILCAIGLGWTGITVVAADWQLTWIHVVFVIGGLLLIYDACKIIYQLIKTERQSAPN
jgi:hypothetical protein